MTGKFLSEPGKEHKIPSVIFRREFKRRLYEYEKRTLFLKK